MLLIIGLGWAWIALVRRFLSVRVLTSCHSLYLRFRSRHRNQGSNFNSSKIYEGVVVDSYRPRLRHYALVSISLTPLEEEYMYRLFNEIAESGGKGL